MVSASVRTMSLLGNQAVSTRKEISSESKTDDFAKMMDESINKTKDIEVEKAAKVETKESEKTFETEECNESATKDIKETNVDEMQEDVQEEENCVEEIPEEVLSVIAATLNISVEELKAAIEGLGMESKDLLDVSNVTKLVMSIKNIDTKFDLLVHEDANDIIKDIQKTLEQLLEDMQEQNNTVNSVETEENVVVEIIDDEKVVVEENIEAKDAEIEENVSDKVGVNELETTTVEEKNNNQATLTDEGEKHDSSSKSETKDNTINNPLNELKENIINEIEKALDERVEESVSTRIVQEIADNISVAVREKMTSLEMQLYPEHLGKVTVLLATEEGGITAKIAAETEMAKNAIEQQLTLLKENFEKQGLKVTDIEVTIASHGFEQNLDKNDSKKEEQQNKNKSIRRDLLNEVNGISDSEEEQKITMQNLGNIVNYLA